MVSNKGAAGAKMSAKDSSNPAGGKAARNGLHKQLRKTKFCMFHLQGACQFGKDCAFAHSLAEMNGTPDLRKTQLCKAFSEGRCEDPECSFAHGEFELRSTDMFFKKSLCIWNEKGKCRNGMQCRFAHGLAELRLHQEHHLHEAAPQPHQSIQQAEKSSENSDSTKDTGSVSVPSLASSKSGRRCKGKPNQSMELTHMNVNLHAVNSSNSSLDGGSSDNVSQQSAEPMKVQPQCVTPPHQLSPKHTALTSDAAAFTPLVAAAEVQAMQQQQQQWQATLMNRLGALEDHYLSLEGARWPQPAAPMNTPGLNPGLWSDLDSLGKGIGMLAAQCDQMQQRMQAMSAKVPPAYAASMLQNSSFGRPYPNARSMPPQWQMYM